jgi:hypothetical protein
LEEIEDAVAESHDEVTRRLEKREARVEAIMRTVATSGLRELLIDLEELLIELAEAIGEQPSGKADRKTPDSGPTHRSPSDMQTSELVLAVSHAHELATLLPNARLSHALADFICTASKELEERGNGPREIS